MSRSLFILKRRHDYTQDPSYSSSYQVATGMYNSSKFVVDELEAGKRECKLELVVDNNDIDRVVTEYKPTHVFLEGLWVVPSKFEELMAIPRHKNVKWHIRIHSEIPFIATEGIAMDWIPQYLKQGVYICPNAPRALEQIKWLATKTVGGTQAEKLVQYLPNCYPTNFASYPVKVNQAEKTELNSKGFIDIACFGAYRPLKNHLQQAFIALRYAESIGKNLRFHTNGRIDQAGGPPAQNVKKLLDAAGAELVVHNWEDRETFLKSLQEIDVLLQVSISETFNIVAADCTLAGTPMLVSKEISWAYPTYGDPQSVTDCLRKLQLIMGNKSFFVNGNRSGLNIYASSSRRRWLSYLEAK
ncbi:hypothetical protein [Acinetobacter sp.]|uniref:hypothetical protein n=1 Tax=Acinetobacter sp. TaxID=472 RepID=UPI00388DE7A7